MATVLIVVGLVVIIAGAVLGGKVSYPATVGCVVAGAVIALPAIIWRFIQQPPAWDSLLSHAALGLATVAAAWWLVGHANSHEAAAWSIRRDDLRRMWRGRN